MSAARIRAGQTSECLGTCIWQATPNGNWTPSYVLDNGSYAKQLVAGRNADGRLDVFYIGSDDKIYHIWQATPNGGWTSSYVLNG